MDSRKTFNLARIIKLLRRNSWGTRFSLEIVCFIIKNRVCAFTVSHSLIIYRTFLRSLGCSDPEAIFGDTYKVYKDKFIPVLYV